MSIPKTTYHRIWLAYVIVYTLLSFLLSYSSPHSPGSKVLSRLILRVVSDEVSKLNSFQRFPNLLHRTLFSLHNFFDGHPEITADEIPFCTAKTLLDQVLHSPLLLSSSPRFIFSLFYSR